MAKHKREEERPIEVEGVPPEEGVSRADAAERVDEDPDAQPNRPEQTDFTGDERRQYDEPATQPARKDRPEEGGR